MSQVGFILTLIAVVLVYRHAARKYVLPRWAVVILFIVSLLPCAVAYMVGSHRRDV